MALPAPTLHVFAPDDSGPSTIVDDFSPAPDWTLLDFYLWHVRPKCLGASRRRPNAAPGTLRQYEIALFRWWQAFTGWTAETLEAGDPFDGRREPRLSELTDDRCDEFLDAALDRTWHGEHVSTATVKKWSTHLNYCLLRTGPRIGARKHFARVLPEAPQIDPPDVPKGPPPDGYSLDQIQNLLDACGHATRKPLHRWEPAVWWRAVILFAYNTGMRPETLFRLRWDHFPRNHPANAGDDRLRVADLPAEILKGRAASQRIWLNDAAVDAIAPLRRPAGLVFGWPWPTAESTLRHELARLVALAGITREARRGPSPFYGFRRAFATACVAIPHESAPIAAALMMNHKPPGLAVMLSHYANPVPLLAAVLPLLPQPGHAKQKLLF